MKVLLRIVAALFTAVAAFLVYAVIHAIASPGGARPGVAVGYIAGAIVLVALAARAWRRKPRAGSTPAA
jgi:multisubunit Na+/H+ antiporter MnhB subunit